VADRWRLGHVDEDAALATLQAAAEAGVNLIDTAAVRRRRSEQRIGRFLRSHPAGTVPWRKDGTAGRTAPEAYNLDRFVSGPIGPGATSVWTPPIWSTALPPTPVFSSDRVYEALDTRCRTADRETMAVSVETPRRR